MIDLEKSLVPLVQNAAQELFGAELTSQQVQFQKTRKEFAGDITLVVFPLVKIAKKSPEQTAEVLGEFLRKNSELVQNFNVVKGFLNLEITDSYWLNQLNTIRVDPNFGFSAPDSKPLVLLEYSSPNTNKPLHLGHLRNNFLGYSVAEILKAAGHSVKKVQIVNDRGIHICKSMVAWQKFGNGETPESAGIKGDKLVGNYYVKFDKEYKAQIEQLVAQGTPKEEAEKQAPILKEAQELLVKWEQNHPQTVELWQTMNNWVYSGFETTYTTMGINFDKNYYESNTYLLGKEEVEKGLAQGIFYKKENGSIWVDLTADGLDEKLLLRADGTAVYMTQDIGTAILRYRDFPNLSQVIYTVGNEQDYHFKVLFKVLEKLGFEWAKECYHLSYGMVDLPSGKMKSREGTVVDADDLMADVIQSAKNEATERGEIPETTEQERAELYHTIGLGALKYYLLKVDPKKRMLYNPAESLDLQGNTGPFIQYAHARAKAILRRAETETLGDISQVAELHEKERTVIKRLVEFPQIITEAAQNYSPAVVANYTYELVKEYNQFYQAVPIFNQTTPHELALRVSLSSEVAKVIQKALSLLGINAPNRM